MHFVDQTLQAGRQRRFWAKILLEPLSDRLADRCAGRTIDLPAAVVSVSHLGILALTGSSNVANLKDMPEMRRGVRSFDRKVSGADRSHAN
jgi:hypothetical protein